MEAYLLQHCSRGKTNRNTWGKAQLTRVTEQHMIGHTKNELDHAFPSLNAPHTIKTFFKKKYLFIYLATWGLSCGSLIASC